MSLKLRLNLIITALLTLVFIAGVALNITNARQNVRAEVESTEKLILYLFDTEALAENRQLFKGNGGLRLQRLQHMRHVRVELYDAHHQLRDSNRLNDNQEQHLAPNWFRNLLDAFSPPWQSVHRDIRQEGITIGQLVITPDPTYEYTEIWKQMTDLLLLLVLFFVSINWIIFWALGKALEPTMRIWHTLNAIEGGNMQARLPAFKLPELDRIGTKFNHMVETLAQSIRRNHQLSQQLINLQESERKSLARDLHDEFAQSLTAIHADSTVVLKLSEKKYPEILESAKAISQLSRHLMEMIGGLLQRLRPGALDELGLEAALQELIANWQMRNENIRCEYHIQQIPANLPEELTVTIYRLVQECLTNVTRHAKASGVQINLAGDADISEVALSIQDDGAGIVEQSAKGFGLLGMRERVEGLGGRFAIHTGSHGTRVEAIMPIHYNLG